MRVWLIAGRELRALFLSPFAWVVLAGFTFICAWLFLSQLEAYLQLQPRLGGLAHGPGVTDLVVAPLFGSVAGILLFVTPLITMHALSGERQNGTLALLFAAPVRRTEIVLGKYLGICAFLWMLLAVLSLMPLSLLAGGALDPGKLMAGLLGLTLLLGAYAAIGLLASTLTESPPVAAFGGFGALLLLWTVDAGGVEVARGTLGYLSLSRHLQPFLSGLVDTADIAYFMLLITGSLALAVYRLESERLG